MTSRRSEVDRGYLESVQPSFIYGNFTGEPERPDLLNPDSSLTSTSSLANLLGTQTTTPTNPLSSILASQQSLITISAEAKTINQVAQTADASGNPDVAAGMRQAMVALTKQGDITQTIGFMNAVSGLAMNDPTSFSDVFFEHQQHDATGTDELSLAPT